MFLRTQKRTLAFLLALILLLSTFVSTAVIPASAAEVDEADTAADIEAVDVGDDTPSTTIGMQVGNIEWESITDAGSIASSDDFSLWTSKPYYNSTAAYQLFSWSVGQKDGLPVLHTDLDDPATNQFRSNLLVKTKRTGTVVFWYQCDLQMYNHYGGMFYNIDKNSALNSSSDSWIAGVYMEGVTSEWTKVEIRDVNAGSEIDLFTFLPASVKGTQSNQVWIKDIHMKTPEEYIYSNITIHYAHGNGTLYDSDDISNEYGDGDSVYGESGTSKSFLITPGEGYTYFKVYSDEDCTQQLPSSSGGFSITFADTDQDVYIRFLDKYMDLEDYADIPDLQIQTDSMKSWIVTTYENGTVLDSNTKGSDKASNYMSMLAFTNTHGSKKGIFSFDYKTSTYSQADGILVYKMGSEPTSFANGKCDNYTSITAQQQKYYGYSNKTWEHVEVEIESGKSFYVGCYRTTNSMSSSCDHAIYIKDVSFTTDVKETTITFSCPEGQGFVSTKNNVSNKYAVTETTGIAGKSAGTFYVIPNTAEGYVLEGVYTTPDYQPATKVAPLMEVYADRTFALNYPAENTTYYCKFTKQSPVTYTVHFDTEAVTNVVVFRSGAFQNNQPLATSDTLGMMSNGETFTAYPGDKVWISSIYDTANYKFVNLINSADDSVFSSSDTYVVSAADDGKDITVNMMFYGYEPVEGVEIEDVDILTRPDYHIGTIGNGNSQEYDHYSFTYGDGVFAAGNTGHDNSFSFLKIRAKHDGNLIFDYQNNSAYGTQLVYKVNANGAVADPTISNNLLANGSPGSDEWRTKDPISLKAGGEVVIAWKRVSSAQGKDCAYIRNISLYYGSYPITYSANDPELGTVSATGLDENDEAPANSSVTLTAAAAAGSTFIGWYKVEGEEMTKVSEELSYTFKVRGESEYVAKFSKDVENPVAAIGSATFKDIPSALDAADSGDTVVVLAGEHHLTESIGIPEGVTLLIPFDDNHSCYTEHTEPNEYTGGDQEFTTTTSENYYTKLIVDPKVTIEVKEGGAISVSAKNIAAYNNNAKMGPVAGKYGHLVLSEKSELILDDGANLYAWGFITGAGQVTAHSGAVTHEYFQIYDFRGGSITLAIYGNDSNQFPFNQYYIQNIESPIKFEYGAREITNVALFASGGITPVAVDFIGGDGVYKLDNEDSYLLRYYDPAEDKMYYDIYGSASVGAISLNVTVEVSSEAYFLPINNIAITVKKNGKLNTDKNIVVLPGSEITVEKGASLNVNGQANIVMAGADIGKYSGNGGTLSYPCRPVAFSPSPTFQKRVASLNEAVQLAYMEDHPATLNNNGSVTVAEKAALCCTSDDANIYSSDGTGSFTFIGDNEMSVPLHAYVNADEVTHVVENEPAVLQNDTTGSADSTSLDTGDRWFEGCASTYTMKTVDGVKIWSDVRTVTFVGEDNQMIDLKEVNIVDKDNIHDYDNNIAAHADYNEDDVYCKYGENGKWTYSYQYPGVSGKESYLKAVPVVEEMSIFEKHSLSLNGNIETNFYLFDAPEGASVRYSWGNKYLSANTYSENEKYTAVDNTVEVKDGYKRFSVTLAAKELNDEIKAELLNSAGEVIATETYKGTDYAYELLTMSDAEMAPLLKTGQTVAELRELARTMLIYSAAAQQCFGYNTDQLATYRFAELNLSTVVDPVGDLKSNNMTALPSGLSYYGTSLNLGSETSYDICLVNSSMTDLDVSACYSGTDTAIRTSVRNNGIAYVVRIEDLPAAKVLSDIELTINGATVTVNVGEYIKNALEKASDDTDLIAVVTALYAYNRSAVAFFEN